MRLWGRRLGGLDSCLVVSEGWWDESDRSLWMG